MARDDLLNTANWAETKAYIYAYIYPDQRCSKEKRLLKKKAFGRNETLVPKNSATS